MPPVDFPRGNNAAAKPPPVPKAPARTAPIPDVPHGRGVLSTGRPAITRPASAYASKPSPPPTSTRTSNNPRGTTIVSQVPAKVASKAPQSNSPIGPMQRLARVIADVSRDAANDPWASIDRASPLMTQPIRQLMYQGMFNQDYQGLKSAGLLPPDANQPPLTFVDRGKGRNGDLSYEVGSGGKGHIYITPLALQAATDPQLRMLRWYGQEIPIHELAHSMQSPPVQQSVPLREGGAQAYADAAIPAVLGPVPTHDTNYTGYVNQVRANQGVPWFMRKQFR